MAPISFILAFGAIVSSAWAHPMNGRNHHHDSHVEERQLPARWYHERDHPSHGLFRRDGGATPTVGSPAWTATFPNQPPGTPAPAAGMPQAWTDALNAAVSAGKIPSFPPATIQNGGNPTYAAGNDPNNQQTVCSATYGCRIPGDIWDAPDGVMGVSFDDGPLPGSSDKLYNFLQNQTQKATHFMIGVNIMQNQPQFNMAFKTLQDDIAVHTWSHPYMTTLPNEQVVAEIGYTMQIIHDLTGGLVPRFWRPPYGDSDARVREIALQVFGLTTVIWNNDSEDWELSTGGTTEDKVTADLQKWFKGPKSPGLVILEHELSDQSVSMFIQNFPTAIASGWKPVSLAQMVAGVAPYQNARNDTDKPATANIVLLAPTGSAASAAPGASIGAAAPAPAPVSGSSSSSAAPSASPSGSSSSGASHSAGSTTTPAGTTSAPATSPSTSATSTPSSKPNNGVASLGPSSAVLLALFALPFMC